MCGIYLTNQLISEEEVGVKLENIRFRGPDHTGIKTVDNITFGHLRLAILDLDSRSDQPMQRDNLTIVFNGEIYNYLTLRSELQMLGHVFTTDSDTEVLLLGYRQWGEEVVPKLNGMFAFAIYDSSTKVLFCSRDRLGVKPFYYFWKDGIVEICSQLRPMAADKKICEQVVSQFLDCTYVPSPWTIFEEVFKLPPGNNIRIDLTSNTFTLKEYWNLSKVQLSNITYDEAKEQLHELIKDAVKIRMQADVPFGSFLSGGIDSALISSIASRISAQPLRTFSVGFDDPKYDESKLAAKYAAIIGSAHTETICKPSDVLEMIPRLIEVFDEPFADSSALPSLLLNKVARKHVTMALSGDGGDESFLGYNNFDWVRKFSLLSRIPLFLRVRFANVLNMGLFGRKANQVARILSISKLEDFIAGIFVGHNSIVKERNLDWLRSYESYKFLSQDPLQKTADLNIKLWLENDSNVKVDRASMASSVEVRSPFLDYRIIEFARTLPVSYRWIPGRKKRLLRDILAEYIPEAIFTQPKKGFSVPIGKWIREELRTEFETTLTDDFLNNVPNLDVMKFKEMKKEHMEGKHDYSSYIWRVYVLSKWYREFGFYRDSK